MSKTILDTKIDVTKPGSGSVDFTIPKADIRHVETEERASDVMGAGSFEIWNHDRTYTGSKRITSGDKLEYKTQLEDESSLTHRWTAAARDISDTLLGGRRQTLSIEAMDFVFSVLSWRTVYNSFEDVDVGNILDTLVENNASEVGRSQIQTVGRSIDGFFNGRYLFDILTEDLLPMGDAIAGQSGTDLIFKPLSTVTVKHALAPSDLRGNIDIQRTDDRIANAIRVDGGTDHDVDDAQTTQSDSTRVTQSSRITHQIQARKSEMARIQVYTIKDSNSSDGLTVRLQADRGGSPVNVSDQASDLARKTLPSNFISNDGFTTFLMPEHSLAPKENPWLIIEATGSTGHDIGTDGNGVPAYKAEYPFPLLTRAKNSGSQDKHRRRDHRVKDDSLETFDAVREKATSLSRHRGEPEATLDGEAHTTRAHNLSPAEAVQLQDWPVDIDGRWICLSRTTEYSGETNRMTTELTLQDANTI